jgi:TolB protein
MICRPDGSDQKLLTSGQALWFAATYGNPNLRGSGSNMVTWSRDGKVLCSRRAPGSQVAWEYQAGRRDTDHFNREFKPEQARGFTQVCKIDPESGGVKSLTPGKERNRDFRVTESPNGKEIAFCRAETGGLPALWVMRSDGSRARKVFDGLDGKGCDHPRWLQRA